MSSWSHRERVLAALSFEEPDRPPLAAWLYRDDYNERVSARWGSPWGFLAAFEVDLWTVFLPMPRLASGAARLTEEELCLGRFEVAPPDEEELGRTLAEAVALWKSGRGLCLFCQVWGVFEAACNLLGMESCLAALALYPEACARLFRALAEHSARQVEIAAGAGVDVIHLSDDWGGNGRMLFSPRLWQELIRPADGIICGRAREAGLPVTLHSDGYVAGILDEIPAMGVCALHPVQESAGMDLLLVKERYRGKLGIYGGLDVRSELPRMSPGELKALVSRRVRELGPGGGFIFSTSHAVQPDTPLESLEAAYAAALGR